MTRKRRNKPGRPTGSYSNPYAQRFGRCVNFALSLPEKMVEFLRQQPNASLYVAGLLAEEMDPHGYSGPPIPALFEDPEEYLEAKRRFYESRRKFREQRQV